MGRNIVIEHGIFKAKTNSDGTWKTHKYIDKVKSQTGKWQYIYNTTKNTAKKSINPTVKRVANNVKNNKSVKKVVNKVSNVRTNAIKTVNNTKTKSAKVSKTVYENVKKAVSSGYSNYKNKTSNSNLLSAGKKATKKVIDKIGASYVEEHYSVATTAGRVVSTILGGALGLLTYEALSKRTRIKVVEDISPKTNTSKNGQIPQRDNTVDRFLREYPDIEEFPYQNDVNKFKDLKEKDYECTKDQDMELVNPFYEFETGDQFYEFTNNCASCSLAYELRQRGYDVEAGAMVSTPPDIYGVMNLYNLSPSYINKRTTTNINKINSENKAKKVEKEIIKQCGEGSRGQVAVFWTNGGGHSMVWECENNQVIIRDCQTNNTYELEEVFSEIKTFVYYRTDNIPNEQINLDEASFYVINRKD